VCALNSLCCWLGFCGTVWLCSPQALLECPPNGSNRTLWLCGDVEIQGRQPRLRASLSSIRPSQRYPVIISEREKLERERFTTAPSTLTRAPSNPPTAQSRWSCLRSIVGVSFFLIFVTPLLYFCLVRILGEFDVDISIPDDYDYAIDSESLARRAHIIGILWSSAMCLFILQSDSLFVSLLCFPHWSL